MGDGSARGDFNAPVACEALACHPFAVGEGARWRYWFPRWPRGPPMEVVELRPADAAALTALYGDHEWWADRTEDAVRQALRGTDLALGVRDSGRLVAGARVVTDGAFYGTVYDVVVATDRRREGIGRRLLDRLVDLDSVAGVEVLDLRCREGLVPFYRAVGFEVHDPAIEVA